MTRPKVAKVKLSKAKVTMQRMEHHSKTFTLFLTLPLELRLMVWRHACLSQVIELSNDDYHRDRQSKDRSGKVWDLRDLGVHGYRTPVVLHVNKEARKEFLKEYVPCLKQQLGHFLLDRNDLIATFKDVPKKKKSQVSITEITFLNPGEMNTKLSTKKKQNYGITAPYWAYV